ncbi:MAG: DUF362 domain-containing protein [bacterium]|nr:DUF362 domain-containing protein [bacterium]
MSIKTNRRNFLKSGALITAAAFTGFSEEKLTAGEKTAAPDVAVAKGDNRFNCARKAVEALGGIKKFIKPKGTIGLLINAPPWWKNPGSFTHPDIVLATILMCLKAGAGEIRFLLNPAGNYWERSAIAGKFKTEIAKVQNCSGDYFEKQIPKGKSLKKVKIIRDLFKCDAFINLPIIKHHTGTHMTCNLKNMMGASTYESNRFFHHGSGAKESYGDVGFLSQCIADLNTLRKPALCIVDAGEVLADNGPAGPGKLIKPGKVVAGVNPVAVDAYCSTLLGLKPEEVVMIKKAHQMGLGTMDTTRLAVKEVPA